jgi:hypothetical protein
LEPAPVKIIEATPTEQMADTPPVKKGKKGRKKDWYNYDITLLNKIPINGNYQSLIY